MGFSEYKKLVSQVPAWCSDAFWGNKG